MRTWIKAVLAFVVLSFLGFLAVAFFWANPQQRSLRLTRADGVIVAIEGMSYGTNHVFQHGSKLLARIQKHVPNAIQKWIGSPLQVTEHTSEPKLIIWYSLFDPATASYVNPNQDHFEIADEHGCVFEIHNYGGGGSTPTFSVHKAYVDVVPRRQKTFTFHPKFANTPALEFTLPNPFYSPVKQEWNTEPLPALRTFGKTNFTLTNVKGYFHKSGNSFESKFNILCDGSDRTDWFSPSVKYIDATGNSGQSLCPYEPAWKVHVDFYHSYRAPFPEEAIWCISTVEAPDSGKVVPIIAETRIGKAHIRPLALCGPGDYRFSNGVNIAATPWQPSWAGEMLSISSSGTGTLTEFQFRKKQCTLLMQIEDLDAFEELLVRAKDETGHFFGAAFRGGGGHMYQYELELSTNCHRISLQFIQQEPFRAEYVIAPPRPSK